MSRSIHIFLFFTLTLLILPSPSSSASNAESLTFLQNNALDPSIASLPSGLQYKIMRTGIGTHHPDHDSPTSCHYRGTLLNGKEFDSSYKRGKPSTFQPRQVIKGWTEAMSLMVEGDKWILYVPSELGYGDSGQGNDIKGGDVLIFEMEMVEIIGTKHEDKMQVRCLAETMERCNEREIKYVESAREKYESDDEKLKEEIARLVKISVSGSDKVVDWCNRRIRILNQLMKQGGSKKEEEL